MLENIKTVLFDLDGTLVDSMWMWEEIDIEYLGSLGVTLPGELAQVIEGMSFSETAVYFKEKFHIKESLDEIKALWISMAMEKYSHEVPYKPGAERFLQELRRRGIRTGICTSNGRELAQAVIEALHIDRYIDCVMTACEVQAGKPSPDIYLKVAEKLKTDPADCLVFEDVPNGIQAGLNAGMTVCAMEDAHCADRRDLIRSLAHYYISSYDQVLDGPMNACMSRQERKTVMNNRFLPVSREECLAKNIEQPDFVYVIGDAYVDHPSFGHAIISRVLESHGYTVAILSQPDFRDSESIRALGEPRLAFLVSVGNMDSMVNHYTVSRHHRQTDAYTPGGVMGKRPDRACIVYCNMIRRFYKKTPIILGGIEASLRRLAHYDYWSDSLKRSILLDCGADLISYGMGERSIVEIADALNSGIKVRDITFVDGTVYRTDSLESVYDAIRLPDYETMLSERKAYAESFYTQYQNTDPFCGHRLVEGYSSHCFVVQNPAAKPLSTEEMDAIYALPYTREAHPSYAEKGGVPATKEIRFSLVSNRGCFGSCSFCALTFHQGRIVQVRSHESLVQEAKEMTEFPDFKGYIHDVGGPTANFRHPACEKQLRSGACRDRQCLFPAPCRNLDAGHSDYRTLLKKLRELPKVKKVFIRSGIRYDYLLAENDPGFLKELCQYHVSGQLKVAPEHISDAVLSRMGKPSRSVYDRFCRAYREMNQKLGKDQYLVPYLMSSHPGSTLKEAVALAEYCRDLGYMPEQVQDFYPTPSTLSTCMYYTGVDPRTMEPVYVPKNPHEKAMQRALIQYRDPKNYELVKEALELAHRQDLIGYDRHCLIRPQQKKGGKQEQLPQKNRSGKKKTIRNVHKKVKK